MKKIFNIFVAVVAMATNTFAQDDTYGNGVINKHTVAADATRDANSRIIQRTLEVMVPWQEQLAVKSLNQYKVVPYTIYVKDLPEFMNQSEIMYGYELTGPVMAYEINDDGWGNKSYRIFPDQNDRFIAFGGVPFILIKGKGSFINEKPKPLVVNTNMTPVVVKQPEPVVIELPKMPEPVAENPAPIEDPVIESGDNNNNVNSNNTTNNYYGSQPSGYISNGNWNACSGRKIYGTGGSNNSYWNYNNNCNNNGGNYVNSLGVSVSIVWHFGNPYYWANDYWWCANTHKRASTEVYSSLCSKKVSTSSAQSYQKPRSNTYQQPKTKTYQKPKTYQQTAVSSSSPRKIYGTKK